MFDVQQLRQAFRPHDRLTIWEQEVVFLIALEAAQRGCSIAVRDEEKELILSRQNDPQLVLDHAGHTSRDYLVLHGSHGERLGHFALDYGNEPGVTLADHSIPTAGNDPLQAIVDLVDRLQNTQAMHYVQIA